MTEQRRVARRTVLVASAATAAAATTGLGILPAQAAVDFAIWDPITNRSTATLTPRRVTMHIAVSTSPDIYGPNKGQDGTYAHFYNPRSARIRQHQTLNRQAVADRDGNGTTISVEHEGMPGNSMTNGQLEELAKVFAWAHVFCGVPNRIATVDNTRGLAWHRLGIDGNFGTYNVNDRTTWCRKQTGAVWTYSFGKECPTNRFINQIPEVYRRAQVWIDFFKAH